ncbi:MAG: amino acid adenylation domain-containing protein, partial [Bacteroidota bacterium]
VEKTPDHIALVLHDISLTYRELNDKANQLAHYLIEKDLGPEARIAVCMNKSVDAILALIGTLKAGAVFVPFDPDLPTERIHFLMEDAKISFVLCEEKTKHNFEKTTNVACLALDANQSLIAPQSSQNPSLDIAPNDLMYIIYTSGSTGRPKGVMIEHGSNVNMSLDQIVQFEITEKDRVLQFASFSFDASISEVFMAFYCGAALVIAEKETIAEGEQLIQYMQKRAVSVVTFPPTYLQVLDLDQLQFLRVVITAGEPADPTTALYCANFLDYYNAYGPTECAVCVSIHKVSEADANRNQIPIGKPLANMQVLILDAQQKLVPKGIEGDIYVSGVGLARGYLFRDDLTQQKFMDHPFLEGERLYHTGDRGKWLEDGCLAFAGRVDDQVKIRGYRIELGEIESTIKNFDQIVDAIVLTKKDTQGNKQLHAYIVVPNVEQANVLSLQEHLERKLPDYMVPLSIMPMEKFPVTISGKIDKKELLAMTFDLGAQFIAPSSAMEKQMASIWSELLGLEKVSITDDFFKVGGHSLLAVRVIAAIRNELNLDVGVGDVFDFPTIQSLISHLASKGEISQLPPIVKGNRLDKIPLTYAQERLWFIDQFGGSLSYHIPSIIRLKNDLDQHALEAALKKLVERHEVLRTVIKSEKGKAYQEILSWNQWTMQYSDSPEYREASVWQEKVRADVEKPFDLSSDYVFRARLIQCDEQDHLLVLVLHHIACDGWSISLLVKDLMDCYHALQLGQAIPAPISEIQYADYAIWQRENLSDHYLTDQLDWWNDQLNEVTPLLLPTDYPRPSVQSNKGASIKFNIDEQVSKQLKAFSVETGTSLFMTLLAAIKVLLFRYTNQEDICIGTPVANRGYKEIESVVGFFLNTLALRSTLNSRQSFRTVLENVKQTTIDAFDHQEVPFEMVVERVETERNLSRTPVFQVMFTLHNNPEAELEMSHLDLSGESFERKVSKFDLSFSVG